MDNLVEDELTRWLTGLLAAPPARGAPAHAEARRLFALLGDPQDTIPSVHVVGTAGKGTFASLLTDALVGAGVGVTTHTSPHVHDIRERFLVDGELPDWPAVRSAAAPVRSAAAELEAESGTGPTFFAATAAIAWSLARRSGSRLAVIEAGVGGRLDATHVTSRPDVVTVVTAIGLDHCDVLGDTVERIAAEKAAVVAARTDTVLAPQPDAKAAEVVAAAVRKAGGRLHRVETAGGWVVDAIATVAVTLPLLVDRLSVATPIAVPSTPRLPPGRMETTHLAGRTVVLDGAHNPMKLAALGNGLSVRARPTVVIAAVGEGRPLAETAAAIVRLGGTVVATSFGSHTEAGPRSHGPDALAAAVRSLGGTAVAADDPTDAARLALTRAGPGDTILVTGSFLHLHAVRDALNRA